MNVHSGAGALIREETVDLGKDRAGNAQSLKILKFGKPGAEPKAYIQAGLHADELPGFLVTRLLREELAALAAEGRIKGEIVVVPVANPIGLKQIEGGYMQGRVERGTNRNFNRGFPDLAALIKSTVADKLGDDPAVNTNVIREAMINAVGALSPRDAFERLQHTLVKNAADADIVLDLHADNQAMLHVYTGEALWPSASDLAAELDARAVLLCDSSGGEPFDEACSVPWMTLADAFPGKPILPACLSATVELRSNNDVDAELAARDTRAIVRFLMRRGVVEGETGALPRLLCEATPLNAMQQLRAPAEGVIDYRLRLGDRVRTGDIVAHVIPINGAPEPVVAETDGILFARHDQTWAWPGKVMGKIAGKEALPDRTGKLLSP